MAEIFLLTRGHMDHVEKFIRSLRSQFFPMKFKKKVKDANGQEYEIETTELIEAQVRPYQLYGFVCPDEFVQPMCNNLGIPTTETWFNKNPGEQSGSFKDGFGVKAYLETLRLLLGAEKLPKLDPSKGIWHVPIYRNYVNVLGIGWHPDGKINTIAGEHDAI